jgi:hypothetical protein
MKTRRNGLSWILFGACFSWLKNIEHNCVRMIGFFIRIGIVKHFSQANFFAREKIRKLKEMRVYFSAVICYNM